MSFTTAWLGLVNYARVEQGDDVIINAAPSRKQIPRIVLEEVETHESGRCSRGTISRL